MSMSIERADRNDIPALAALRLAYIREDSGGLPADRLAVIAENLPGYFEKHLGKDLIAFVCRSGTDAGDIENAARNIDNAVGSVDNTVGNIVGCCLLYVSEKPPGAGFPTGRTGTVLNVYTAPEHRRKGIGRLLMRELLACAEQMKLDHVELKATEMGYPLYKSLGFEDSVSGYREMKFYCRS